MLVRKAYKNLTVIPLTFGSQKVKKTNPPLFGKLGLEGMIK